MQFCMNTVTWDILCAIWTDFLCFVLKLIKDCHFCLLMMNTGNKFAKTEMTCSHFIKGMDIFFFQKQILLYIFLKGVGKSLVSLIRGRLIILTLIWMDDFSCTYIPENAYFWYHPSGWISKMKPWCYCGRCLRCDAFSYPYAAIKCLFAN